MVINGLIILFYGAEPWCLAEKILSMLRIFQHQYVRIMSRVTLAQSHNFRISNEELQRSLNLRTINDYVTKNQLRRTSHGALISFDRLFKKILSS